MFVTSRGLPADPAGPRDGVTSEPVMYRRGVRDDRYPALLPGVDKAPRNSGNSFIGDDVEKLYDFTTTTTRGTDAACRAIAVADYAPAVERAASTVDVGGTLSLFGGADRLYQSAATLACPLCVHAGSAAWTHEALYVERRPAAARRDHDADCPLHVDKSAAVDVGRWHDQEQSDVAMYPPGLRSPDQIVTADDCQRHDLNVSRSQ